MTELIYKIAVESFELKDEIYNVAMSPELYGDDGGIDFTGSYTALLLHPSMGTLNITLSPNDTGGSRIDPNGLLDPNVIYELEKLIAKIEGRTARQF